MYIFLYDCEQTFGAEVKQPQSGRPRCAMLLISLPKEVLDRITLMASLDDGVRWYPVVGVISAVRATCADSRELCRFSTVCHRVEERILNRNRVSVEVWSLMVDGVRQSVGVRISGRRFSDCLWTVVLYRWRTVGGCLGNTMFRQFIHRVCVRQNHSAGGWDLEPVGVPFELGTQPGTWVVGRESRRWHPDLVANAGWWSTSNQSCQLRRLRSSTTLSSTERSSTKRTQRSLTWSRCLT